MATIRSIIRRTRDPGPAGAVGEATVVVVPQDAEPLDALQLSVVDPGHTYMYIYIYIIMIWSKPQMPRVSRCNMSIPVGVCAALVYADVYAYACVCVCVCVCMCTCVCVCVSVSVSV